MGLLSLDFVDDDDDDDEADVVIVDDDDGGCDGVAGDDGDDDDDSVDDDVRVGSNVIVGRCCWSAALVSVDRNTKLLFLSFFLQYSK